MNTGNGKFKYTGANHNGVVSTRAVEAALGHHFQPQGDMDELLATLMAADVTTVLPDGVLAHGWCADMSVLELAQEAFGMAVMLDEYTRFVGNERVLNLIAAIESTIAPDGDLITMDMNRILTALAILKGDHVAATSPASPEPELVAE
jgi:hypothetical protein